MSNERWAMENYILFKPRIMKCIFYITTFLIFITTMEGFSQQQGKASLLLDLKKARASYENARQQYQSDKKLWNQKAISQQEFEQSKNNLLRKEVDYQKLLLQLVSRQSYLIIENAVKYQNEEGKRRVKLTIKSATEGNQEYLNRFKEHFDVFTPQMSSGKIYNIFISLASLDDQTIIGSPYEARIPSMKLGGKKTVSFHLLRDVQNVQVQMSYSGKTDRKNIFLEKGKSANVLEITSTQFSQEADLGTSATYDLSLERFTSGSDVFKLSVVNLPGEISADFHDAESNARVSQIKFNEGVNVRNLSLKVYLPERTSPRVKLDSSIQFYALAVNQKEYKALSPFGKKINPGKLKKLKGGTVNLEITPRGVGEISLQAPNLYHEITVGDSVRMRMTVENTGTRTLSDIQVQTDKPYEWTSVIEPELIETLDPNESKEVQLALIPPRDVGIGAHEITLQTEALANNQHVKPNDKTLRIKIESATSFWRTAGLILLLIGFLVGIVIFGIKISKR